MPSSLRLPAADILVADMKTGTAILMILLVCIPACAALGEERAAGDEAASMEIDGPSRLPKKLAAFALGGTAPVSGRYQPQVPVVYALYYSGEEGVSPFSLWAELETTAVLARASVCIGSGLFASIDVHGTYGSHNAASYFTDEDGFDPERSFLQSVAGSRADLGFVFAGFGRARVFAGAERFICSKFEGASPYRPPADHTQVSAGIAVEYRDLAFYRNWDLKEGYGFSLDAAFFTRDRWDSWGFEESAMRDFRESREWFRLRCSMSAWLTDRKDGNLFLGLKCGFIGDADRSSAMRIGSMVGDVPLAGTSYGRIAADRWAFLRTEYSFGLWEGCRASAGADLGVCRDLAGEFRRAMGIFVSLTQKILGLPVMLTYGFCPVDFDGVESLKGHEIQLIARAALF